MESQQVNRWLDTIPELLPWQRDLAARLLTNQPTPRRNGKTTVQTKLADALIRWARRLDPNSCLDWHALPHAGQVVIPAIRACVGDPGHHGYCCSDDGHLWKDPEHGMHKPEPTMHNQATR